LEKNPSLGLTSVSHADLLDEVPEDNELFKILYADVERIQENEFLVLPPFVSDGTANTWQDAKQRLSIQ